MESSQADGKDISTCKQLLQALTGNFKPGDEDEDAEKDESQDNAKDNEEAPNDD